jgi:hypothetical protein
VSTCNYYRLQYEIANEIEFNKLSELVNIDLQENLIYIESHNAERIGNTYSFVLRVILPEEFTG